NNFKQAIALFQAGNLNDAERCFKQVLRHQPKHVAALNLLSVLLTHLKRLYRGRVLYKGGTRTQFRLRRDFLQLWTDLKSIEKTE
ncbi:MAG TPA: tetratricopeptide repeat protein, partial [Pseudolabrys sp.]